tara:strand:+ start:2359 stop:3684 length:1326 start_codon:yes stop_codon:yes gene_type:complete
MAEQLGGLSLLNDDDEDNPNFTYGVYQQQAQTPDINPSNLQDLYGTASMPVFEWVRTIRTGERTYTPGDDFDDEMLEKYREFENQDRGGLAGMPSTAEIVAGVAAPVLQSVGQNVVRGVGDAYLGGGMDAAIEGGLNTFSFDKLPEAQVSELAGSTSKLIDAGSMQGGKVFAPELAGGRSLAESTGNLEAWNALNDTGNLSKTGIYQPDTLSSAGFQGSTIDSAQAVSAGTNAAGSTAVAQAVQPPTAFGSEYLGGVQQRLGSEAVKSAGVNGLISFGINLASGMKPKQAAKSAGASAIGSYIGQALIPIPVVGGVIGGAIGSIIGGRVICNELQRQGIMTRKQVALDYKFTRDYLTPQHVNGYHLWAVWMVRQMRKGKLVNFWKHVAGHRANEIAYIYGEREKPDYLGKIYRKILEPTCWVVGYFCKKTDWSTLYNEKEV